jgi:hypothetical protein
MARVLTLIDVLTDFLPVKLRGREGIISTEGKIERKSRTDCSIRGTSAMSSSQL